MKRPRNDGGSDRAFLVAFYYAASGVRWTNNSGWLTEAPIGEWYGVTTNAAGYVVSLNLSDNQLVSSIPSAVENLVHLESLELAGNDLTGTIPTTLGTLTRLSILDLGRNDLEGKIPTALGLLANLRVLGLGRNRLEGSIPSELGQLENLQRLSLGGNQLTGRIPASLGRLSDLMVLGLGSNQLTGAIPSDFGKLVSLEWLDLGNNQLTGTIPSELGQLASLRRLDIQHNLLSGQLPDGSLASIQDNRELDEAHKRAAIVHEYAVVPIELYNDAIADTYLQAIRSSLGNYVAIGSCDHIDAHLLDELGVRITHCFRRSEEHYLDYDPEYVVFLGSNDSALANDEADRARVNGSVLSKGMCLLFHRETQVDLRAAINLVDTTRTQLDGRMLRWRNDALTLAVRIQHWFSSGRTELASKVVSGELLSDLGGLVEGSTDRWQAAELMMQDAPIAFVFAFIDIQGNDQLDTLERARTLTTCLEAADVLDSVLESRIGENPLDHHMTQMMQQPWGIHLGAEEQQARASQIATGSFDEQWHGSVLPNLVRGLDRDLASAEMVDRARVARDAQPTPGAERGTQSADSDDTPWRTFREADNQSWLRAERDTVVMASTRTDHRQQLVALEVALQSVWNRFERSARNLPAIARDSRRRDLTGDTLLRELSEQYLRVTNWRIGLSAWPRAVMDELRRASSLDENIRAFFEASEEYVRYEEVVREKEARDRERNFQKVVTIAALALAAVVLGEITISIAGEDARARQSVAVLVALGALLVSPWLVASTYDDWSPHWRRWGLLGGSAFLAPMVIALPWQADFWLYGEFWWPWPGLPLFGVTVGWVVGCSLRWRTIFADVKDAGPRAWQAIASVAPPAQSIGVVHAATQLGRKLAGWASDGMDRSRERGD